MKNTFKNFNKVTKSYEKFTFAKKNFSSSAYTSTVKKTKSKKKKLCFHSNHEKSDPFSSFFKI